MSARDLLTALVGRTMTGTDACPDCCADVSMDRDELGIFHMTIRHDDTCPQLAERDQRREGLEGDR